jgi:hypothetical protein
MIGRSPSLTPLRDSQEAIMFKCDLRCNNMPIIDIGDPEKTCA